MDGLVHVEQADPRSPAELGGEGHVVQVQLQAAGSGLAVGHARMPAPEVVGHALPPSLREAPDEGGPHEEVGDAVARQGGHAQRVGIVVGVLVEIERDLLVVVAQAHGDDGIGPKLQQLQLHQLEDLVARVARHAGVVDHPARISGQPPQLPLQGRRVGALGASRGEAVGVGVAHADDELAVCGTAHVGEGARVPEPVRVVLDAVAEERLAGGREPGGGVGAAAVAEEGVLLEEPVPRGAGVWRVAARGVPHAHHDLGGHEGEQHGRHDHPRPHADAAPEAGARGGPAAEAVHRKRGLGHSAGA